MNNQTNNNNQSQDNKKICKFFLENKCKRGDQCKFVHNPNICKYYFIKGKCDKNDCKYLHTITLIQCETKQSDKKSENEVIKEDIGNKVSKYDKNKGLNNDRNKRRKPKNTESFVPSYEKPDMYVKIANTKLEKYQNSMTVNDVIIAPQLFPDNGEKIIYHQLLNELNNINNKDLWKSWHENNHFIADDDIQWKEYVPTFGNILRKIEEYFNVKIKATRLNWYKDTDNWKPYHHDAAAIKPHIAKIQNITIAISFGCTRDASFEHCKTKNIITMPQEDGCGYVFCRDVNIEWKHGILKVKPENYRDEGRISIIAWGWTEQCENN